MLKPNDVLLPEVRRMVGEGHTVTLRVRGNSMRPFLEDRRDKVVLSPFERVMVGDVVLAEISKGHFVLHRIIEKVGENLVLKGDGNNFGTESCTVSDVAALATGFYRGDAFYQADSSRWRIYSRFWMNIGPMRRWFLAAYRRIPVLQK